MRRVALAGVLVQEPRVLILDEPTVGLDGPGKREILAEIRGLHRSGKTVVIISHSIEDVAGLADRLVVLEQGRVLTSGVPAAVFSSLLENGKLTFLVPSISRLLHDLRVSGWEIPGELHGVEEAVAVIDGFLRGRSQAEN
jgi:energy-coupling factor transport system ATP-binding protein